MGPKGDEIARHVAQLLGSPVHFCGSGRDDAAPLVAAAYGARAPIIGVCAAGVLIRLLGTDLGEKVGEPPVLAVSADGKMAVPLLGSHRGANALARWIADGFRGTAAITSFSDTLYDFALDDLPPGYALADAQAIGPIMAALLNGEKLKVEGFSGWLELAGYPVSDAGSQLVRITESAAPGPGLTIHPKTLVVGLGCTSQAGADEILGLVGTALAEAGLAPASVAAFATVSDHGKNPAVREAASRFGVPLRVFTRRELDKERGRLEAPSETVEAATGLMGVCEAAALKAGALLLGKRKSAQATCAIGKADTPVAVERFGKGV